MGIEIALEQVKRSAIIAVASDPELRGRLALKGGTAIDIAYDGSLRSSRDVDFSLEGDVPSVEWLASRLQAALDARFAHHHVKVFELKVLEKPDKLSDDMRSFWGGYNVLF